jgi:hypothetical protein
VLCNPNQRTARLGNKGTQGSGDAPRNEHSDSISASKGSCTVGGSVSLTQPKYRRSSLAAIRASSREVKACRQTWATDRRMNCTRICSAASYTLTCWHVKCQHANSLAGVIFTRCNLAQLPGMRLTAGNSYDWRGHPKTRYTENVPVVTSRPLLYPVIVRLA